MIRTIRIALGVCCILACVGLVILWVQSSRWLDVVEFRSQGGFYCNSASLHGVVSFSIEQRDPFFGDPVNALHLDSQARKVPEMPVQLGINIHRNHPGVRVYIPHWMLVATTAFAGVLLLRVNSRFSVKTLLFVLAFGVGILVLGAILRW